MQRALNDLGVGQSLKEDGVYGEKTQKAVDKMIDKMSEFLTDLDKIQSLKKAIDAAFSALDFLGGSQSPIWEIHKVAEKCRYEFQRTVWKMGAEHYLRRLNGYNVAALLLEHSLEQSPSDLHFTKSHEVTQKIIHSNGFQKAFCELEKNILENPDVYAVTGSFYIDFQKSGDTDLYYGIGKCEFKYTCTRDFSSVRVKFTMEDKYNFDHIRPVFGSIENIFHFKYDMGSLANNLGLFSQADGVISIYMSFVEFEETIELN